MERTSFLANIRPLPRLLVACHSALLAASIWAAASALHHCSDQPPVATAAAPFITAASSALRIIWIVGTAATQAAVASTILMAESGLSASALPTAENNTATTRRERRMRYMHWLWWGRFGAIVTLLQLIGALYLTFHVANKASLTSIHHCSVQQRGHWHLYLSLVIVSWVLAIIQCCIGPEILAWSSFYANRSDAWRAHYHEKFDYRIREFLCCLGRAQYLGLQEDEVSSVAAILGDLITYRAADASHLGFFAGLKLLQHHVLHQSSVDQFPPAPEALIQEATILHPYAIASYTGPLLDVGRNPLIFPCIWIYRQGFLTPWNWNRWPRLEGDNWWRGHAAAFLRHLKLPPDALCRGRVSQAKREAAFFVVVVHQLQRVIVSIRGTETPEDLLTDALGRECVLTKSDLHGLLCSQQISAKVKQHLISTMPHFGHEGIVQAARELSLQLDSPTHHRNNNLCTSKEYNGNSSQEMGLLSSLLGNGGKCEGYDLQFVGHSLGGSIAALIGIRLYTRYPHLRVYAYGPLPCLDAVIADACSNFITSIVYKDEFSSRLSVLSLKRLQDAAIRALASDTSLDSNAITRLARELLGSEEPTDLLSSTQGNHLFGAPEQSEILEMTDQISSYGNTSNGRVKTEERQQFPNGELCAVQENRQQGQATDTTECACDGRLDLTANKESKGLKYNELFVPGLIIHVVPVDNKASWPLWKGWSRKGGKRYQHRAFIKDKECFRDIAVSPSMFIDHFPWRCQYALNSALDHMVADQELEGR